jgi:hypothetical protein
MRICAALLRCMDAHQQRLWLGLLLGALAAAPCAACLGDCDLSCEVTVTDIVTMVDVALGELPITDCQSGDANGDGIIVVNEIINAVNNALNGCLGPDSCGDGVRGCTEECDERWNLRRRDQCRYCLHE